MPVTNPPGSPPISTTAGDIVLDALLEVGVLAVGETAPAEMSANGLRHLQRLLDELNAVRPVAWTTSFQLFTLTANHAPHTFGPGGDFNVTTRPVEVLSASFILNSGSSNPVDLPIRIRDNDWWAANPLKSLVSSVVTNLYYDPAMPQGNLNFWPISNIANPVRLETRSPLDAPLALASNLVVAPGYWNLIVYRLAESLLPSYPNTNPLVAAGITRGLAKALSAVLSNNDPPPRIDTNSGMPGSNAEGRPDFNFLTGLRE